MKAVIVSSDGKGKTSILASGSYSEVASKYKKLETGDLPKGTEKVIFFSCRAPKSKSVSKIKSDVLRVKALKEMNKPESEKVKETK